MQRRSFLKLTGTAGILAAQRAPAFAQGSKVHVVRWVDFIPEADVELKRQAPEASKALGAEVQFEFINANDLQPRITAGIQSGSGADIFQMLYNWPQLYANGLVDVSDVAEAVSKAQGGFYEAFDAAAKVGGRWLAVPHSTGGNAVAWRRSWHAEIGLTEFPTTMDAWREAGRKLKAKGRAVGQALGDSFGAAPPYMYPARGDEVQQEPEAGQGPPDLDAPEGQLREVVRGERGLLGRRRQGVGRAPDVGEGRQAAAGVPPGGAQDADARLPGTGDGKGHRVVLEVHHRRHVREGRAGHEGRGRREVGRDRAQEDL